jgi:hypothetical protein
MHWMQHSARHAPTELRFWRYERRFEEKVFKIATTNEPNAMEKKFDF